MSNLSESGSGGAIGAPVAPEVGNYQWHVIDPDRLSAEAGSADVALHCENFGMKAGAGGSEPPEPPRESNPTYLDVEHLERDLQTFLARLHAVVGILAWRFGLRLPDQEDLYQTVFLKAWSNPTRVPQDRGQRSWLFVVAYRSLMSTFRKNRAHLFLSLETALFDDDPDDPDPSVLCAILGAYATSAEKQSIAVDVRIALSELGARKPREVALLTRNAVDGESVRAMENPVDGGRTKISASIRDIKQDYRDCFPEHAAYVA